MRNPRGHASDGSILGYILCRPTDDVEAFAVCAERIVEKPGPKMKASDWSPLRSAVSAGSGARAEQRKARISVPHRPVKGGRGRASPTGRACPGSPTIPRALAWLPGARGRFCAGHPTAKRWVSSVLCVLRFSRRCVSKDWPRNHAEPAKRSNIRRPSVGGFGGVGCPAPNEAVSAKRTQFASNRSLGPASFALSAAFTRQHPAIFTNEPKSHERTQISRTNPIVDHERRFRFPGFPRPAASHGNGLGKRLY